MNLCIRCFPLCSIALVLASWTPAVAKTNFKKWLDEEVVWIISQKERTSFLALRTDQDRDEFIRKFWERRDPTPSTPRNEYKEEHYRRFEYAIKNFQEGTPGWKTDRGRVYILHGPPAKENFFTSNSPMDLQGRGDYRSRTPNTITWTYHGDQNARYFKGEVILVFQPIGGMSRQNFALGESKTAQDKADELNRQFGDATDQTWMESDIRYRLILAGPPSLVTARGAEIPTAGLGESARYMDDLLRSPGDILEESLARLAARESARQGMREAIATRLSFGDLPMSLSSFSYLQPDGNYRVQLRVDIPGPELARHLKGSVRSKDDSAIDLYCALLNPSGSVTDEFVDSAIVRPAASKDSSLPDFHYSNGFSAPAGDYRLVAAVRSASSERMGSREASISLNPRGGSRLQMSDIFVTDRAESVPEKTGGDTRGVIFGDMRLLVSPELEFDKSKTILIYVQLLLPQGETLEKCDLSLGMNFISGQSIVKQIEPRKIVETNSNSGDVVNFATSMKLESFRTGSYTLQVQAIEHKSKQFSIRRASFSIK